MSISRVVEYSKNREENLHSGLLVAPESWPEKGEIVFDKVYFNYDQHLGNVLKNLKFKIKPMEKIGLVGYSGAGKSTIIHSLFRTAQLNGLIEIDGINISDITLKQLRDSMSIIPVKCL